LNYEQIRIKYLGGLLPSIFAEIGALEALLGGGAPIEILLLMQSIKRPKKKRKKKKKKRKTRTKTKERKKRRKKRKRRKNMKRKRDRKKKRRKKRKKKKGIIKKLKK